MNKNVLLVLVVIIVPIIIMGFLAVNGAKNIPAEEHTTDNTEETPAEGAQTEAAVTTIPGISAVNVLTSFAAYSA